MHNTLAITLAAFLLFSCQEYVFADGGLIEVVECNSLPANITSIVRGMLLLSTMCSEFFQILNTLITL